MKRLTACIFLLFFVASHTFCALSKEVETEFDLSTIYDRYEERIVKLKEITEGCLVDARVLALRSKLLYASDLLRIIAQTKERILRFEYLLKECETIHARKKPSVPVPFRITGRFDIFLELNESDKEFVKEILSITRNKTTLSIGRRIQKVQENFSKYLSEIKSQIE